MEVKNIGIFGRRNTGKSSLVNILAGQEVAIADASPGTTTDPVRKRIEIYGIGACNLIDTAGFDDSGELGGKRVERTLRVASEIDLALLLFTGDNFSDKEEELMELLGDNGVPVIIVHNKVDIKPLALNYKREIEERYSTNVVEFSCADRDKDRTDRRADALISLMVKKLGSQRGGKEREASRTILQGLITRGDEVVLVCPIDSEVPTGRLILPEVMAIRDMLDRGGIAHVLQPQELGEFFKRNSALARDKIKLVITDSQAFATVAPVVPEGIPLGSFSILLARAKGPFGDYLKGVEKIKTLKEGDDILILESCTHRATCDDIGRAKLPALLQQKCGIRLNFTFISGTDPLPSNEYALAVQCGGCMVTGQILRRRIETIVQREIPVTNYGLCIAFCTGLFDNKNFNEFLKLL